MLGETVRNPLLGTDVYKMGHMEQYPEGTQEVYSYLTTRNDKEFNKTVFFGLQYYLKQYLTTRLTPEMGEEFLAYRKAILGSNSKQVEEKIRALCALGYFPLEIKSVEEGMVMDTHNVLMTLRNTHKDFPWVVGFVESMLLKLWYPITVASCCHKYRMLVDKFFSLTVDKDMDFLRDFTVHDFGYRGDSSEEGAGLSGVAHLLSFLGSDTVPAFPFAVQYYNASITEPVMYSVPASEHSVMCAFGREDELSAFHNMLNLYPSGLVSIVSDTFNIYTVLTEFAEKLKDKIMARNGKTVFRPDSGNPEYIICGDPNAPEGSNEWLGAIRLLDKTFGHTVNEKGYKVLDSHVGLIYGDGMYYQRYEKTLERLMDMGYAACNLVIGVGGILRNWTRDTLGFAIKATRVIVGNTPVEIEKDPITDHRKKSHKGLLALQWDDEHKKVMTVDECSELEEKKSLLKVVFSNGVIMKQYTLREIRDNIL